MSISRRSGIMSLSNSRLSGFFCCLIPRICPPPPRAGKTLIGALRRHNYGQYIANGPTFAQVREAIKSKQKQLKRDGKGNMPNKSDAVSDEELEIMWQNGQLGGSTPDSILQTLWFYNTVHFGLRGSAEHRDMCWGDVELKSDGNKKEYLEFNERQTKTRTGENPRDIRAVKPKLFANLENPDRCPVNIYKVYAQKRPQGYSEASHPFYIASTTKHLPSRTETWFKRNPVGVNKLQSMMSRMVTSAGITTDKHLTNHSARKYLIQKLNDNEVPANHIMQISGHKNIASINNYSHLNQHQHQNISRILHNSNRTVRKHSWCRKITHPLKSSGSASPSPQYPVPVVPPCCTFNFKSLSHKFNCKFIIAS